MSEQRISAVELLQKNKIDLDGNAKDFSQTKFWYYTKVDTVSKILESRSFHVSNLARMNDKAEALLHDSDKEKVHALCFCNSRSEKIPMWYLYAGLSGKGAAIGITPSPDIKMRIKNAERH